LTQKKNLNQIITKVTKEEVMEDTDLSSKELGITSRSSSKASGIQSRTLRSSLRISSLVLV